MNAALLEPHGLKWNVVPSDTILEDARSIFNKKVTSIRWAGLSLDQLGASFNNHLVLTQEIYSIIS